MQLLVEKTLEYQRVVDPQAEVVIQELATQYESLIDASLSLLTYAGASNTSAGGTRSDATTQRQLREKDREIKRLQDQLKL